ncbi:rRNA maturation RNase YbeY [Roseinatronobacter bogoriensis]|uniref:rRNA maturation RNase YbeY n=1 Tax=Roseinatronobacter bogoriensis TaxID=119542 RepID=UPI0016144F83|nr:MULTISPECIES: rRNA maturation RNase YbeY [Rhodobaca]MBB4206364.1 putative rRNA maturation factor [Rhodobaca bogoriensis DSM 18756]
MSATRNRGHKRVLVDVVIEDPRWNEDSLQTLAEAAADAALRKLGHDPSGFEVVLLACDDGRIAGLNAGFRGKAQPTNVLSWPEWDLSADAEGDLPHPPEAGSEDDPEPLGNIALSYDTCTREATEQGKNFDDHLRHLIVHSVLHLLGYDHIRDKDAALMEETEVLILAQIGVSDPYEAGAEMPL